MKAKVGVKASGTVGGRLGLPLQAIEERLVLAACVRGWAVERDLSPAEEKG